MNKTILSLLAAIALAMPAYGSTIALWTFETGPVTGTDLMDFGPLSAEVGAGLARGHHANATTDWNTTALGNGSPRSFLSQEWTVGDYYQFEFSSTGFTNLSLSFDQTGSAGGPRDFVVQTSSDLSFWSILTAYILPENTGANTWNATTPVPAAQFGLFAVPDGTIGVRLVDVSTVSTNGGTVTLAGTSRVDNVHITGDVQPVPEPASMVLVAAGLVGVFAVRARRRRPR